MEKNKNKYVLNEKQEKIFKQMFGDRKGYSEVNYFKYKYRTSEVDTGSIALESFMKLVEKGIDFNKSYLQMQINNDIKQQIRNNQRKKIKMEKGLISGDIPMYSGIITDDTRELLEEEKNLKVIWKKELTEEELLLVEALKKGMNQRDIYKEYNLNFNKQQDLKQMIKTKIELEEVQNE